MLLRLYAPDESMAVLMRSMYPGVEVMIVPKELPIEPVERFAYHDHYCRVCSNGSNPGTGCINCRNTGMDQTPCHECLRKAKDV